MYIMYIYTFHIHVVRGGEQFFGLYFAFWTRDIPALYNESAIISLITFTVSLISIILLPLIYFIGISHKPIICDYEQT